ncbi:MAG: UDP-GlcNAc--UDP-phosphate GlcNAc-phosphate transferase [Mucilaginibacter sp.]|nr:UDP-GlcNAc--UDP-phosphate GlcNAc-phosphate transferase [Mucilaginibacter sp.]
MIYLIIAILFLGVELLYFRIADRYNIIDHPNERSSHNDITIRGGGVIFLFAALIVAIMHPDYWLPVSGILIIGAISFMDDRLTLSSRIRLLFHLIAVTIMFFYLHIFHVEPFYVCLLLYIMVIGVINMYNFMDGINGITGLYSLVILGGLQYVNLRQVAFVQTDMIWLPILACIIFLYFNFRKKAKCFAGDVGSVTIAFWIIMLLVQLILLTHNWAYILFLVVYGIDSVLTITHRLLLKQNIFKAHRLHFYQILANERKMPHLWVALGYALLQGLIILLIISYQQVTTFAWFIIIIIPLVAVYILMKMVVTKRKAD